MTEDAQRWWWLDGDGSNPIMRHDAERISTRMGFVVAIFLLRSLSLLKVSQIHNGDLEHFTVQRRT
jgi:hypothetical protein